MKWTKTEKTINKIGAGKDEPTYFKNEEAFMTSVDGFASLINQMSKMVKMKIRKGDLEFKEENGNQFWHFTFELGLFGLKDDYLDFQKYEEGNAYVYIMDSYYDMLALEAYAVFGSPIKYNNTGSTGWIYGHVKGE